MVDSEDSSIVITVRCTLDERVKAFFFLEEILSVVDQVVKMNLFGEAWLFNVSS